MSADISGLRFDCTSTGIYDSALSMKSSRMTYETSTAALTVDWKNYSKTQHVKQYIILSSCTFVLNDIPYV